MPGHTLSPVLMLSPGHTLFPGHTLSPGHRPTSHLEGSCSSAPALTPGSTTTGPDLGVRDAWGSGYKPLMVSTAYLRPLQPLSTESACRSSMACGYWSVCRLEPAASGPLPLHY